MAVAERYVVNFFFFFLAFHHSTVSDNNRCPRGRSLESDMTGVRGTSAVSIGQNWYPEGTSSMFDSVLAIN